MFRLISPTIKYKKSYIAGEKEFAKEDGKKSSEIAKMEGDFKGYMERMYFSKKLKRGWVPGSSYWLMDGNIYIGEVRLRHKLNAKLLKEGGHIGYGIRPSKRKKGYGTKILAMVLPKVKKFGIKKALVTCDDSNVGSWKIIEANGGILKNKIMNKGKKIRRYYIKMKQ
jgi:predicted acetyltransferase